MRKYSVKQIVIAIGSLLIILGIVAFTLHILIFRVTKTIPAMNTFPSFVKYVEVYTSQPIKSVESVTLNNQPALGRIEINGNWLRYTHPDTFTKDSESTLVFNNVTSMRGSSIDITYMFTPRYMDFSDVPSEVKDRSISKSSSGQADDPFFNNYFPIISRENSYEIELIYDGVNLSERTLYVTFYQEVFDYDTNQQATLPNNEAEEKRLKVLEQIKELGGKPENYKIQYANKYLEQKYNPDGPKE